MLDAGNGDNGRNFTYDPLNRLSRAELLDNVGGIAETLEYDYDAVGNRIERRIDGVAEVYTTDTASNRLLSISGGVTLDDLATATTTLTYNSMDHLGEAGPPETHKNPPIKIYLLPFMLY